MQYILKNKKELLFLSILAIVNSILTMLVPIIISFIIQAGAEFDRRSAIIVIGIVLIGLVVKLILIRFKESFACKSNTMESLAIMKDLYHLNYDSMQDKGPTYYIERLFRTVETLYLLLGTTAIELVTNIIVLIISLVIVFTINSFIAVLMVLLLPLNYILYTTLNKKLQKKSKVTQESYGKSMQELMDLTSETDFIKQQSNFSQFLKLNEKSFNRIYKALRNVNVYSRSMSELINSINKLAQFSMYIILIFAVVEGGENVLSIILFSIVFPIYFGALTKIVNSNIALRDLNEGQKFIAGLKEMREESGTKKIEEFSTLDFNINQLKIGDRVLSENITGQFNKGDIVSVNGESGKGKSTLLKLIPKFRTTDAIYVNGEDVRNIDTYQLREYIYYMSQDVPVIMETVENNILLGNENCKERFNDVIKIPVIKKFLDIKGLKTKVTENGSNLSGGERQKIALARALCSNMEVLILDEISSNIDKESSYEIYKTIAEQCGDKLIFIISHDKMHLEFCNREVNL